MQQIGPLRDNRTIQIGDRTERTMPFEAFFSRKFIGFMTATGLFGAGYINEQTWVIAFGIYVGANVFEKLVGVFPPKVKRPARK